MKGFALWILSLVLCVGLASAQQSHQTMPSATSSTFNSRLQDYLLKEPGDRLKETGPKSFVASGGLHATSGSMVSASFATTAYGSNGHYINQASNAIDYSAVGCAGTDTAWVVALEASSGSVGGNFTRVGSTRYAVDCTSATQPTLPSGGAWLMRVTIAGSALSAVLDLRLPASYVKQGRYDITDPLYGAVAGADSTTAIQAAVTGANGRTVYFPAGTYIVTAGITDQDTVDLSEGTKLVGDGMYLSLIDNRVASGYAFTLGGSGSLIFQRMGHVKNLGIITTTSPASSGGIFLNASYQMMIENVRVQGLTGDGIRQELTLGDADGSVMVEYRRNWLKGNGGIGLNITSATSTKVENSFVLAEHNFITGNTGGGMNWVGLAADIRNNAFTLNAGFGGFRAAYNGSNNRVLLMSGNDFEHNGPQAVELQSVLLADFTSNECIQTGASVPVAATSCFLFGGTGSPATVEQVRFTNTFIRVNSAITPHTAFNGGAQANSVTIEGTHWNVYDDAGQSRFSTLLLGTVLGVRIVDKDASGVLSPYPNNQHTLNTTISGSGETYTPNPSVYSLHRLAITATGTTTIAAPTPLAANRSGVSQTFVVYNNSGGVVALSWNAAYLKRENLRDPLDGERCLYDFRRHSSDGWLLVATSCRQTSVLAGLQTVGAGDTVLDDACPIGLKRLTAAGAVTTDTTNTFSAPAASNKACIMHVCNVGANAITLDNNANFLSAGSADVVLTANDCVIVGSSGLGGRWYQLAPLSAN